MAAARLPGVKPDSRFYPAREVTNTVTSEWLKNYRTSLPIVAGTSTPAEEIGLFASNRPEVYIDLNPATNFWTSDQDLKQRRGICIWEADNRNLDFPGMLQQRFPNVVFRPPLNFSWESDHIATYSTFLGCHPAGISRGSMIRTQSKTHRSSLPAIAPQSLPAAPRQLAVVPGLSSAMPRLHAIDALRGTVVLVVGAHAAVAYMQVPIAGLLWPVHQPVPNPVFDGIFWWIQAFLMPLVFLVSGLMSAGLADSLGIHRFLLHRARRILLPLVLGTVTILPFTFYVWAYGWWISGRCTIREILRWKFSQTIQPHLYGFAHLWFLEYLFLFCVAYWVARLTNERRSLKYKWKNDRVGRLLHSPWKQMILVVPAAIILWVEPGVMVSFHNSFLPDPLTFLYYGLFFAAGVLLLGNQDASERISQASMAYMLISVPVFIRMSVLIKKHLETPLGGLPRLELAATIALCSWLLLFGHLGLSLRFLSRPNAVLRYLSDASYWIYLCHLPIAGLMQVLLYRIPGAPLVKFLTVVITTLTVSLLTYQTMVRNTVVGILLSETRKKKLALQLSSERELPC